MESRGRLWPSVAISSDVMDVEPVARELYCSFVVGQGFGHPIQMQSFCSEGYNTPARQQCVAAVACRAAAEFYPGSF